LFSLVSEQLFLFVQDSQLLGSVLDFSCQLVNLAGQLVDFSLSFSDFVGSEVNSSIVASDFCFTINLICSVFHVGFLLLKNQVLSERLEHLGNVSEGSLVFHLEGDGVKQFFSHVEILDFL